MSNEELLARIGQNTEETEFYTPMPPGYRKGHHKYVVVVGTVMSGLGKGIFSSSLAKLLQDKGLRLRPSKWRDTSTSIRARSIPIGTARCSCWMMGWKRTWIWGPMSGCWIRICQRRIL